MSVTVGLRRWTPEPPGDNRPALARWPRWRLLLDRPAPASVLVIGEADPDVERWLNEIAVPIRWVGGPRGLIRPAELVVVGADAVEAFTGRNALRWLERSCSRDGAVWLPWRHTRRHDVALAAAGFGRRLWQSDTEPVAGRWKRSRASVGVVAARRGPAGRPPSWLLALGAGVGSPPSGWWSLSTPGAYPSQKAIAKIGPVPGGPGAIVKLAQDPRFADRVQNEALALRGLLAAAPDFAARRAPAVLGEADVGGVAVVVEKALWGRPFLRTSSLRADCAFAADAAAAATELADVRRVAVPGRHMAHQLEELRARFVAAVHPTQVVGELLAEQVAVVAARATVPAVVVHGDLGTWNLLVLDGSVRILDWESAAANGPPLWDLAYLARSYAVRSGRRRGLNRSNAIDRHLVTGSPLTATIAGWFATYRDRVGLDPELGEALFHTCWMHRAVKEAARVGPGEGHYGALCSHLVERRRERGLRQLLGT